MTNVIWGADMKNAVLDSSAWGETGKVCSEGWVCSAQIKSENSGYRLRAVAGNGAALESPDMFVSVGEARSQAPALCEKLIRAERAKCGYAEA